MSRPPITDRIMACLLRKLAAGHWQAGARIPPSRRLAAMFGASHPAIMKAVRLAGRQGLLDVRPRQPVMVMDGAAQRARQLLGRRTLSSDKRRVAVLLPEGIGGSSDLFHITLIRHSAEEASRKGIETTVVRIPVREQVAATQSFMADGHRAAVWIGFEPTYAASLALMHESEFPVMLFNRRVPGLRLPTVRIDDYVAAQTLARHLTNLGHRNLCLVAHFLPEASPGRRNMAAGWIDYLDSQNLIDECSFPLYVLPREPSIRRNPFVFANLLQHPDRPTAIVLGDTFWAQRLLTDSEFARFRVPRDISLAVFFPGRTKLSLRSLPPLSSVDVNYRRAAECIVEMVSRMLDGNLQFPVLRVPLDITLTESLGPPPQDHSPSPPI